jgi:gas vesicle protein
MEAFYEGLFSSISKNVQAEQFTPSKHNLIDYYLSLIENYVYMENDANRTNGGSSNYDNVTAYLSANIDENKIKFRYSEFFDSFGSNIKDFISAIEQWFKDAVQVVIEFAGKTYEVAKDVLIRIMQTLQELFVIAKTKFEEAIRGGKVLLDKVGEMLRASFDTIRQAFFTAFAYTSNAIKTLFTGLRTKQENLTYESIKAYNDLPVTYFAGKIFTEFEFTIDTDKIADATRDFGNKVIDTTKDFGNKVIDTTKDFGNKVIDTAKDWGEKSAKVAKQIAEDANRLAEKFGAKVAQTFKSILQTTDQLNREMRVEFVQKASAGLIEFNKNYSPDHADIFNFTNEKFVNSLYANADVLARKVEVDNIVAEMIKTNTYNYEAVSKYYADILETKTALEKYIENVKMTIGKYDPTEAEKLIVKAKHAIKIIDSGINNSKHALEIAQTIEKQKLLAEKVFKNGLLVVASVGLLFYAYRVAKGYEPLKELIKAAGLSMGLVVILLVVKYITEHSYQLKLKLQEMKSNTASASASSDMTLTSPEGIIATVFVVSLGIAFGTTIYKMTNLDEKEGRQIGEKTGKILRV